jgi:hypothetical protein
MPRHCLHEAATIARISAFAASGRLSLEAATSAKSGGILRAFSAFSTAR